MSIIDETSSRRGQRDSSGNRAVAEKCLADPALLRTIAAELGGADAKLAADCAEVFVFVATERPELAVPYAEALTAPLAGKDSKGRWEAMHALALVADRAPDVIESILPKIRALIENDKSVIVRDYATEALAGYAGTSVAAANRALPFLLLVLDRWGEKHAGRALNGLRNVLAANPALEAQIIPIAAPYAESSRGVVRKEATRLLKLFPS